MTPGADRWPKAKDEEWRITAQFIQDESGTRYHYVVVEQPIAKDTAMWTVLVHRVAVLADAKPEVMCRALRNLADSIERGPRK
jgi:hypothetical protein